MKYTKQMRVNVSAAHNQNESLQCSWTESRGGLIICDIISVFIGQEGTSNSNIHKK